jgi:hypothetical protein
MDVAAASSFPESNGYFLSAKRGSWLRAACQGLEL